MYRCWTIEGEPVKWGISNGKDDMNCTRGEAQTMSHLINCNKCPTKCDMTDLQSANNKPIKIAEYWSKDT